MDATRTTHNDMVDPLSTQPGLNTVTEHSAPGSAPAQAVPMSSHTEGHDNAGAATGSSYDNSHDPMWRKVLRRPSIDPNALDSLVSQGYEKTDAKTALRKHSNDLTAAGKNLQYMRHLRKHWGGTREDGCPHCDADVHDQINVHHG